MDFIKKILRKVTSNKNDNVATVNYLSIIPTEIFDSIINYLDNDIDKLNTFRAVNRWTSKMQPHLIEIFLREREPVTDSFILTKYSMQSVRLLADIKKRNYKDNLQRSYNLEFLRELKKLNLYERDYYDFEILFCNHNNWDTVVDRCDIYNEITKKLQTFPLDYGFFEFYIYIYEIINDQQK